jgi:protein-S-isoprenylcysteine O-methyltransferase Ste14
MSLTLPGAGSPKIAATLDIVERAAIVSLFGFFVYRMTVAFADTGSLVYLILTISESLVVLFVIIRRTAKVFSTRPLDWLLAFGATAAPLLAEPLEDGTPLAPAIVCSLVTLAGLVLQIIAKLTLRRNFGIIAANRGITVGGPYNFVRHPMYSAYMLTWVGFFLANPSFWNLGIYVVAVCFQVARLFAEERLLNDDATYRQFAASVRYRLVPKVF